MYYIELNDDLSSHSYDLKMLFNTWKIKGDMTLPDQRLQFSPFEDFNVEMCKVLFWQSSFITLLILTEDEPKQVCCCHLKSYTCIFLVYERLRCLLSGTILRTLNVNTFYFWYTLYSPKNLKTNSISSWIYLFGTLKSLFKLHNANMSPSFKRQYEIVIY